MGQRVMEHTYYRKENTIVFQNGLYITNDAENIRFGLGFQSSAQPSTEKLGKEDLRSWVSRAIDFDGVHSYAQTDQADQAGKALDQIGTLLDA